MPALDLRFWLLSFSNEARFSLAMMRRYLFDTVVGLVTVYVLFVVIFFGLRFFAAEQMGGDRLDALIVGYIMWMFAMNGYMATSNFIIDEAKQGTLEQLFMAPAGFQRLMLLRLVFGLVSGFVFNAALLLLTMLTTGRWLDIPLVQTFLLISLGMPAVWGLGYVVAGFALLFKRVAAIAGVMQFVLIALVSVPAVPLSAWSLLPFSAAANVVNGLIAAGAEVSAFWYAFIALNSLAYFVLGLCVFRRFARRAMQLNVLGHY